MRQTQPYRCRICITIESSPALCHLDLGARVVGLARVEARGHVERRDSGKRLVERLRDRPADDPRGPLRRVGELAAARQNAEIGGLELERHPGRGVAGARQAAGETLGERPQFFFNQGGKSHWLTITLRGTRSNRDGYGARVQVNNQVRFATAAGSYLCSNDKRLHFGLADRESSDIEVRWPSGVRQVLHSVKSNRFIVIEEPEK